MRGIYESGNIKELIRETANQETKQLEIEIIDVENMIFFKSGEKHRIKGTGFILQRQFRKQVLSLISICRKDYQNVIGKRMHMLL